VEEGTGCAPSIKAMFSNHAAAAVDSALIVLYGLATVFEPPPAPDVFHASGTAIEREHRSAAISYPELAELTGRNRIQLPPG
jgi:hypothetical protein